MLKRLKREAGKTNKDLVGVKKDKEDKRDYLISQVLTGIPDKPQFYQIPINPYIYVKDQGKWNSCVWHAICGVIAASLDYKDSNLKNVDLSERFGYYFGRLEAGKLPENVGLYIRDNLKIAQKRGVCPEKLCPYIDSEMNNAPGYFTNSFAKLFRIKNYYRALSIEEVKAALLNNFFVLLGTQTNASFKRNIGPISVSKDDKLYGGHAIWVYGYDNIEEELLCVNSWGKSYKDKGIMRVPFVYYNKYVYDSYVITI